MRRLAVLICAAALFSACSAPPQKELDRAQGALDAARAAGAEQYAADEFSNASTSLQLAHEAVRQNDYRLALSRAVDAYERAQEAARQGADGKARARSESEAAVTRTAASLQQLQAALDAAATARVPARELAGPRRVAKASATAVQKAREDVKAQRYLQVEGTLAGVGEGIAEQIEVVERARAAAAAKKPARRRR